MHSVKAPCQVKNRISSLAILVFPWRKLLFGLIFTAGFYGYAAHANHALAPAKPAAPSNLIVQTVSATQLDLVWGDNASDEDGFKIERKESTATVYAQIATVGPNIIAFSDTGLTTNTKYFYRLRAFNRDGASEYSFAVSGATLAVLPAAPANLIVTAVSSNRIDLAWQDNANNETGFRLERKNSQSGSIYQQVAQVAANVTAYASAGINASTKYFYRVRAFNAGGASGYSNETSATTLPKAPAAPGNLAATTVSNTKINLAWLDNSTNEDSFKIERASTSSAQASAGSLPGSTGSPGAFALIARVGANTKKFLDSSLTANTAYFYRVRAANAGGASNYSNEAGATTLPDKPAAPGNLTAITASQTQINLSWQDQAANEDSFKIERRIGVAGNFVGIATVGSNVTKFADNGLAEKTEYSYRLCAFNLGGHSEYSNEAAATTLPGPPAPPENLTATPLSGSRLALAWQDNATNEDGFKIERKKGATGAYAQVATLGPDLKQFADSTLATNTLYFYRVRAFNVTSHSNYTNEASAKTFSAAPAAPGNLTATAVSNKRINLAWLDNSANEDSFIIERRKGGSTGSPAGEYAQVGVVAANNKIFSDQNLAAGTEYFYRVRTVNGGGPSDYSNLASATTFPDPPVRPGHLTATPAGSSRINLAWTDSSDNETGFRIERRIGAIGIFVEAAKVNANVTSFADTGLAANLKYFYRLRAFNVSGPSAYSTVTSAATAQHSPEAPSDFVTVLVTHNRVLLAWQDNSNIESGFRIERSSASSLPGAFIEIAVLNANVTSFTNTGLSETTQYFYRLRAFNNGGPSAYTDLLEATTAPSPPFAPGSLTATALSHNRIKLAWKDSSRNEAGFTIERKIGLADFFVEVATVDAQATSHIDSSLQGNTTYLYRLRAFNVSGFSSYSNPATATTPLTPPNPPTALKATTVSSSRINLAWQDKSANEDSFRIERASTSSAQGSASSLAGAPAAARVYKTIATVRANLQNFSDAGLASNTAYFYRVRAFNKSSISEFSNEASATTLPLAPAAPRNLAIATMSSVRLDIAWTDSANNEAGFELERRPNAGSTYTKIAMLAANHNRYSDHDLAPNTPYFYRVRAVNTGGASKYSNEASAATFPAAPNPPDNLLATTLSHTQIKLTWEDNAANEDSFRIERSSTSSLTGSPAGGYKQIAALAANATQFVDTGLSATTVYLYRLRASNKGGSSDYSNEANATTLPNPPAAPDNLTATTMSSARINLAWQDNAANEDSFKIERASTSSAQGSTGSPAGVYKEIARVAANVKSFSDLGLLANTAYFYRVRASNAGGLSAYSNEASATTKPTLPLAPANLTATAVSNKQIKLIWEDNATNEDSFRIDRKLSASGAYKQVAVLTANSIQFTDFGLSATTVYFYRVRATNKGGSSAYSNEANATTLPNPPAAPDNLIATATSSGRINLAWQDNAANEESFKIERSSASSLPGSTGSPARVYKEIASVAANIKSFSDLGLSANTAYFYRVRAINAGGPSVYSNEASATTKPTAPLAPANLAATTVSNTKINLTWEDKATNEDSFKIDRKLGATGAFAPIAVLGANVTAFADTGLAPNTGYFYRVRAKNSGGSSGYSNDAGATTLPNRPLAPLNLKAVTVSQTQINLTWADSAKNEIGFKLERASTSSAQGSPAGDYVQIAVLGANIKNYSDTGLAQDTEYFYRVRAYNSGGHSDYSAVAGAITLPNIPKPPAQVTAITKTSAQIDLVWADSSNNESGFKIERKTGLAGTFAEIGTVAANVTKYSSTELNAITRYFFRVRAHNRGGQSIYSNVAEATTLPKAPLTPNGLAAVPLPNFQVDLAWLDNSANEDSFQIERKLGGSTGSPAGVYAQIAQLGKDIKNYRDSGVLASALYFYRVRALNSGGPSGYSNEAPVTTLVPPPIVPASLTAATLGATKIRLAWADSSHDEKGFRLERKTGSAGVYAEILTVGPNVVTAIDSTLKGNTEYFYRLRAFNIGGESNYSNEAGSRTLPFPPAKPTSLVAAPFSNTKISLTWLDNSDNEAGFRIERKLSVPETYVQVATIGANATAFTDTGLAANTGYYYRIRAYNPGGVSGYSNETTTKTLPNPPAPPRQLTVATISNRQLNLAWKDSSNNENGFKIERKTGLNGTYNDLAVVNANVKTYADSTLAGKTAYFYRVRAFNAGGNSEYSNEATATTLPNPPAAPDNITAALVTNRQVRVIWADNSINETGFKVERKKATATGFTLIATLNTNVTTYADTGLISITAYVYRVLAFNAGGNSPYSSPLSVTTLPNQPTKPDSLSATAMSHSRIDLKWRDLSDNESGFYIERKIGAAGAYAQIAAVGSGETKYSDTNLSGTKEYFYRVRAFNAGGHSVYTNEVKNVTLPIPPGSLIGAAVTNRRITLAWTDSSNNENGFKIERRLFETDFVEIAVVGANIDMYADSILTPNTLYYYRVRAFNLGGVSAYSAETPIATLPNPPAAPQNLSVTPKFNLRMELAWSDNANNELGFAIERKLEAEAAFTEIGNTDANVTAYLDTSVAAQTRYFYRLRAFNSGGYSAYSNEGNNLTFQRPPAAPNDLIATVGGSSRINLIWTDNADNEAGFAIQRKFLNDTTYTAIATLSPNVASYANTGLTKGATYVYRIYAFNDGGASVYSAEVNATPDDESNLAIAKPATASGTDISTTPGQAVDGDLNTYWRSNAINVTSPQAWLRVELNSSSLVIVDRVVIRWHQTYFAPEYEIQTSTNGASWTTHADGVGAAGAQEITFTATTARFVRLYLKRNNKANYRVAEFEVYNGVSKASRPTTDAAAIPATVTLRSNYPNPFNPATTIFYTLPEGMHVTLKVLNIAGQEVATLVEQRQERGVYQTTFNARKLPSGVYFAVLQAGSVRQVQRMLLAK